MQDAKEGSLGSSGSPVRESIGVPTAAPRIAPCRRRVMPTRQTERSAATSPGSQGRSRAPPHSEAACAEQERSACISKGIQRGVSPEERQSAWTACIMRGSNVGSRASRKRTARYSPFGGSPTASSSISPREGSGRGIQRAVSAPRSRRCSGSPARRRQASEASSRRLTRSMRERTKRVFRHAFSPRIGPIPAANRTVFLPSAFARRRSVR